MQCFHNTVCSTPNHTTPLTGRQWGSKNQAYCLLSEAASPTLQPKHSTDFYELNMQTTCLVTVVSTALKHLRTRWQYCSKVTVRTPVNKDRKMQSGLAIHMLWMKWYNSFMTTYSRCFIQIKKKEIFRSIPGKKIILRFFSSTGMHWNKTNFFFHWL